MKVDTAKVLKKGFKLIDIDNGSVQRELTPGNQYELEHAEGKHPLAYYVLKGTRKGAIQRFWEDSEKQGLIRMYRQAEDGDPTLAGIRLPIRNSKQLTEFQKTHLVCGHLVKGKFLCERCTLKHNLVYPDAIPVYPVNILPYSQACQECGLLVFDVWQSRKGGPLCLFG